jgi:hypothetical protein
VCNCGKVYRPPVASLPDQSPSCRPPCNNFGTFAKDGDTGDNYTPYIGGVVVCRHRCDDKCRQMSPDHNIVLKYLVIKVF